MKQIIPNINNFGVSLLPTKVITVSIYPVPINTFAFFRNSHAGETWEERKSHLQTNNKWTSLVVLNALQTPTGSVINSYQVQIPADGMVVDGCCFYLGIALNFSRRVPCYFA